MAFSHQEALGPHHADMRKFTELEEKFFDESNAAREQAREMLKAGRTDEAVKLLNETFARQFAEADKLMTDCGAAAEAVQRAAGVKSSK